MNELFLEKWKSSGLSISELSRQTGLAYSLIYDIVHQKKDINQRTAADVTRIAAVLGTTADQIMNPFCMVDGYRGNYKGIKYYVKKSPDLTIYFEHDGIQEAIPIAYKYDIPERFAHYIHFIEMAIDLRIEEKKMQQHLKEVFYARQREKSGIHSDAQIH